MTMALVLLSSSLLPSTPPVALRTIARSFVMCAKPGNEFEAYMNMLEERPVYVQPEFSVELDEATVAATAAAASADDHLSEDSPDALDQDAIDVGQGAPLGRHAASAGNRDAAVVQSRETATFFEGLLAQRGASRKEDKHAPSPIEATVEEQIRQLGFLQHELECACDLVAFVTALVSGALGAGLGRAAAP